jgi:hypothetical protein
MSAESGANFPFFDPKRVESDDLKIELEIVSKRPPLFISHVFSSLGIKVDNDPPIPDFEIVSGFEWPQVEARYIVTQPDALTKGPSQGWAPVGGIYPEDIAISPSNHPQFMYSSEFLPDDLLFIVRSHDTFLSLIAGDDHRLSVRVPLESVLTKAEARARFQSEDPTPED